MSVLQAKSHIFADESLPWNPTTFETETGLSDPSEDLKFARRQIKEYTGRKPNVLIMHPDAYAAYEYYLNTVDIEEWPGFIRRRGPDGKTWLVRKRQWEDFYRHRWGNGNKARRRLGLEVGDEFFNPWAVQDTEHLSTGGFL